MPTTCSSAVRSGVGRFAGALTLAALMPLSSAAQVRIDVWTTDDGLPQNSVTGLTQTHDGYIWFTTNEGLVRFDGARFKVFNRSNTPEITSNRMLGAFTDRSGRIWMSTEEGYVLFHAAGRFHVVKTPDDLPVGMPSRFFDAPSGGVIFYIGRKTYSEKKRYEHLHYRNGKLEPLEIEGLAEDSYLVLTDKEGGLWFAGDRVLQRFKDGAMTSVNLGEIDDGDFGRIAHEDHRGNVWVGHWSQRSLLLRIAADGRVDRYPLPPAHVSSFMEDARGNLWISLLDHGVYRVDRSAVAADATDAQLVAPVALTDRIPDFSIGHLWADREGGVWIGTNGGLVHLRSQSIRVFSKEDGLPEENVYPVYEDRAGRIWAGIWQNTLVRFEGDRFHTFLRTADTRYVTSLFEDRSGRFWIGTASNLYYLDGSKLVRFTEQAGFPAIAEFSVITQDRDDALWFGTDQGLSRRADGQVTLFNEKGGLPDDYITALLLARDGRIWVGTRRGLGALVGENVTAFTTVDGLASNHIRSLHEDSEGVLWIGSYDGGLTRFKDGEFTTLTVKDGLFSNGVFCILDDQRGWFWMNSNQGIFRVKTQQLNEVADGKADSLTSIAYDKRDGLLTVEGNGGRQPAGVVARDGKLWFPTARGIAMVDPQAVTTNPIPPPVLIEEIVVDGEAVAAEELESALVERSAIVLTPDQANLEITYTGISFLNAGQVKFRYKLEGQDRDWVDVGTRRTAYYSYLPAGAYTFRVIAANRDGVWNSRGASVAIRVLPPFYATTWFITLSVAVLACLAWAVYRGRVHRLRQQEKKLRNVVETIPATTWTALPDGSVDFISQQWREYTGPVVAQTACLDLQATIHPDDLAQYADRWHGSLATGTLFECEARFRRGADREYRLFLARAVPLQDARGRILKWYGVLTDIEERKRAEAELERSRQLQADLAHMNRVSLLGELTASLAHEVNQPITATITNASASLRWLARDQPDLDEARTAIKRIEQEARRTAEIVGRVKAFYKKGAPPRRESVDVNQVVGEMRVLLRREAKGHSVVMRTDCAPELPVARADRVQLQQVLMNLMLNGIEAMEERGGVLTIKTEEMDGHVLVAVSDDGVGLPADRLDRIFDSFFTTKDDGTGMGLSISRSIIEAHGGRLWASNNEGIGATFYFTLPVEQT